MSDYKTEQDWLMSQIEVQQEQFENQKLTEVIDGIDGDLRSKIVKIMRMNKALAKISARECFERWKAGYMEQRTGALKILERAITIRNMPDLDL